MSFHHLRPAAHHFVSQSREELILRSSSSASVLHVGQVLRMPVFHLDLWKCKLLSSLHEEILSNRFSPLLHCHALPVNSILPLWDSSASGRSTLNLERGLYHDEHPLAITAGDAVASGVPPWSWRETPGNGGESQSYAGRVISVKWGEYTRRIGIDGNVDAIKDAIKSAFGLRTKRRFWLEDEDEIIRVLDRDMPLANYTLHLDEGLTIKVCLYDDSDRMPVRTEDKTLYTDDDFRDFLSRRGWTGLRELSGYRRIDTMDDLHPGTMYHGVRLLGD
ncbi:hypothetical protein HHK36_015758 [Tetracentron sinense]|uniref:GT-1/4-like C-terminal domain-containing protein n=1 Tax=Tetracentron sinense TaxID=13715 RepID=A0A835DD45_TETSI|nr:hypothetical protein HHK36_015758 [Tetracentron sinense]